MTEPEPALPVVADLTARRRLANAPERILGNRDAAARAVHELADLEDVMDELGIGVPDDPDEQLAAIGESLADRLRRGWENRP